MLTRPTHYETDGTSFFGDTVAMTPAQLKALCVKYDCPLDECNDGRDKTNYDAEFKTEEHISFTVYDWKEGAPLRDERVYAFHIGAHSAHHSRRAKYAIIRAIEALEL